MATAAFDDVTQLLRVFHLVERAFSKFFNAARKHPEIDGHLTDWLLKNKTLVVSSLVSSETVYASYPYDLITFLNSRIAEASVNRFNEQLEQRREQALNSIVNTIINADRSRRENESIPETASGEGGADAEPMASQSLPISGARPRNRNKVDIREGVAKPFSEAWNLLASELKKGLSAVLTDDFLELDLDIVNDPKRRKEISSSKSPAAGWRHRRNTIEDFQTKLSYVIKARNTTMHGYLPRHATPEIIIETIADVFNSMQHYIGKHIDIVPEGHLFLMGEREIAAYARGEKLSAPDRSINGVKCLLTSYGLRRDAALDEGGEKLFWPTSREADKVWVTMQPVTQDRKRLDDGIESFKGFVLRDKDLMGMMPENCKIRVKLSRFIPTQNEHDEKAPPAWRENLESEPYACFWFGPNDK